MHISRVVIRNFRNFAHLDVRLQDGVTCVIGENNTGKSNFLRALRLAVDVNLSSQFRQLLEHDIHSGTDLTEAGQVVVSAEFVGYDGEVKQQALLGPCEVEPNLARIHFRYRPTRTIREEIDAEIHDGQNLSLTDDYHFELTGGGDKDPSTVNWNEDLGASLRFGDLQAFNVECLHPQLQRVLYRTLSSKQSQVILTTHSTHISSLAPIQSFVTLTNDGTPATSGVVPEQAAELSEKEKGDLDRYLDATRSSLLFARKVMLVEGPTELFLIPMIVKQVMNIDLDRHGIAVVPIFGTHFEVYAKLFGDSALRKKCAIVCDGDQKPEDVEDGIEEDDWLEDYSISVEENDFVQVYECPVTFERAMTLAGTLPMFVEAVRECEFPENLKTLEQGIKDLETVAGDDATNEILGRMRLKVLNSAKSYGKARFAQTSSKYSHLATEIPSYIKSAVEWLLEE